MKKNAQNTPTPDLTRAQWISQTSAHNGRPVSRKNPPTARIAELDNVLISEDNLRRLELRGAPFPVAFAFEAFDETPIDAFPPAPYERKLMPPAMAHAIMEYETWAERGANGDAPLLAGAADSLCSSRIAFWIGLGGSLFCESSKDAHALNELFA